LLYILYFYNRFQQDFILICQNVFVIKIKIEIKYNPLMHKTQLQKLVFLVFSSIFGGPQHKSQLQPQKQTHWISFITLCVMFQTSRLINVFLSIAVQRCFWRFFYFFKIKLNFILYFWIVLIYCYQKYFFKKN
jgi:hypothetical protein